MPIRIKLIIIVLALVAFPLALVSIITFANYQKSIEKSRLTHLQELARYKAERIETYFAGFKTNILMAQYFYNIRKNFPILLRRSSNPGSAAAAAARQTLDRQLYPMQKILDLANIILTDTGGRIVYATSPEPNTRDLSRSIDDMLPAIFNQGEKGFFLSDIIVNKSAGNRQEVLFFAPLADLRDVPAGAIVFELDMASICRLIKDTAGLGVTGEVLIGKKSGNEIEFLNPLRHNAAGASLPHIRFGDRTAIPIQKAISGETGIGEAVDYRGEKVVAAWRYLPSLNWGLVAKIDSAEEFAMVSKLKRLVIYILAGIFVLISFATLSVARSIARPIQQLTRGAEIVGSGNLDHRVGTSRTDEIGRLSRSFDRMTHDLKLTTASRDVLDREIVERTRAEEEAKRMAARFELLSHTAGELLRTRVPERLIEPLCQRVMAHLGCDVFFNFLNDETAGKFHLNTYAGISEEEAKKIEWLDFGISLCGRPVQESGSIVAEHVQKAQVSRTGQIRAFGIQAFACIHIPGENEKVIGTLAFGTRRRETFSEDELSLMTAIADQAAISLARIRTEQTLHDLNARLEKQVSEVRAANKTLHDSRKAALNLMEDALQARKQAEQAAIDVRESREDLNRAQAVSRTGSWRMDVQNNVLTWSDEAYRIFGVPTGTLLAYESFLAVIHPDDRDYVDAKWKACLRGEPYDVEHRVLANGKVTWVRETASLEYDESGAIRGGFGTTQDITERKRMENELAEKSRQLEKLVRKQSREISDTKESLDSETKERIRVEEELSHRQQALEAVYAMATAFDSSFDAMNDQVVLSIAKILHAPLAAIRYMNRSRAGIGSSFFRGCLTHDIGGDSAPCTACTAHRIQPDGPHENPGIRDFSPCKTCFPHEEIRSYAGVPILNVHGEKQGMICVLDSVERAFDDYDMRLIEIFARYLSHEQTQRELESQLMRSNELRVLGQLTSGVAHEVRNPLNGIMAIMSALSKELSDTERFKPYLHHMQNQVSRLTVLMEDLLSFGRPVREENKADVPVVSLVENALSTWQQSGQEGREVRFIRPENANAGSMIHVDGARIEQAIINLLDNAHQHSAAGQRIDLSVEMPGFHLVRISVRDSGSGIPKENLSRIFDPFFTTRKSGTGLGLSIVRHIVESHGGSIIALNNGDRPGATFAMDLPLSKIDS